VAPGLSTTLEPEEILADLLRLDPDLRRERYWGESSLFYNPGRAAPLGVIFASLKDHDGANDSSSRLSRDGVYRFAFCLPPETYTDLFGDVPPRPPKGGVVSLADYDPTRTNTLMPHPVYAWMRWVQILSPTAAELDALRPHLDASLALVRERWKRRRAA
jgi:Family of unknown function (DUF6194)